MVVILMNHCSVEFVLQLKLKPALIFQFSLDSRIGWIIQEAPSLIIAALAYFRMPGTNWNVYNLCAVSMFVVHYFQR